MGRKKRPLTEQEIEDQGLRSEERRYAWTHGRGSPFQTCVAKLAYPPLDPASLRHILALAWTPHYAAILQNILEEARRDPGQDGFTRGTEAAREVWNDIMGEPRKRGGRPREHTEESDLKTCWALEEAIADARTVTPAATEEAVLGQFVRRQEKRWLSENDLTNKVRLLTDTLQRTRRRYGPNYDELVKPIRKARGQKTPPK
jgi:hypothetical protein